MDFWDKRVRDAEKKAKKRAEEYAREQEQYSKDLEEIGDANGDLSIQKSCGFSLPVLHIPLSSTLALYRIENFEGEVACKKQDIVVLVSTDSSLLVKWSQL